MKIPKMPDWAKTETVNYILSERLCEKHAKSLEGKRVVQMLGICSKCLKGGIVYYDNSY